MGVKEAIDRYKLTTDRENVCAALEKQLFPDLRRKYGPVRPFSMLLVLSAGEIDQFIGRYLTTEFERMLQAVRPKVERAYRERAGQEFREKIDPPPEPLAYGVYDINPNYQPLDIPIYRDNTGDAIPAVTYNDLTRATNPFWRSSPPAASKPEAPKAPARTFGPPERRRFYADEG